MESRRDLCHAYLGVLEVAWDGAAAEIDSRRVKDAFVRLLAVKSDALAGSCKVEIEMQPQGGEWLLRSEVKFKC